MISMKSSMKIEASNLDQADISISRKSFLNPNEFWLQERLFAHDATQFDLMFQIKN